MAAKAENTTKSEDEIPEGAEPIPEGPDKAETPEGAAIDRAKHDARAREELRQAEVVAAVAEANASELPKLGGANDGEG